MGDIRDFPESPSPSLSGLVVSQILDHLFQVVVAQVSVERDPDPNRTRRKPPTDHTPVLMDPTFGTDVVSRD